MACSTKCRLAVLDSVFLIYNDSSVLPLFVFYSLHSLLKNVFLSDRNHFIPFSPRLSVCPLRIFEGMCLSVMQVSSCR